MVSMGLLMTSKFTSVGKVQNCQYIGSCRDQNGLGSMSLFIVEKALVIGLGVGGHVREVLPILKQAIDGFHISMTAVQHDLEQLQRGYYLCIKGLGRRCHILIISDHRYTQLQYIGDVPCSYLNTRLPADKYCDCGGSGFYVSWCSVTL